MTTSYYGPDAYEFAKGKPITLLDGGNLLHLLAKHGHRAKIDLKEAKKRPGFPNQRERQWESLQENRHPTATAGRGDHHPQGRAARSLA